MPALPKLAFCPNRDDWVNMEPYRFMHTWFERHNREARSNMEPEPIECLITGQSIVGLFTISQHYATQLTRDERAARVAFCEGA